MSIYKKSLLVFSIIFLVLFYILVRSIYFSSFYIHKIVFILFIFIFLICLILIIKVVMDSAKEINKNFHEINWSKVDKKLVYSKKWNARNYNAAQPIIYDIMVDNHYLYLIQMPQNNKLLRFVFVTYITSIKSLIYNLFINSIENKEHETLRSKWIDKDVRKLKSNKFEKYVVMKIPINLLKKAVTRKRDVLRFSYQGKIIYLKNSNKKIEAFLDYFKP